MAFHLGLIGYPLGHSLSPQIHKAALDACGLEGDYFLFPLRPDDRHGLNNLLARIRSGEVTGLNVTIPHKQAVIPLLDELTPRAKAIGAVNTISMQSGRLTGDNTDAPGFLADLYGFLNTVPRRQEDTKTVLVLGAGGSARAVVHALANDGWDLLITARRPEQAKELIAQLPISNSHIAIIEYQSTNLRSLLYNLSLLINTTPLGMLPDIEISPWPADLPFPPNAAVYDLVYNPRETKLVGDARVAGLIATTGLGMLVEQAALAFETWTGCKPSRKTLWNAVENS